jgi:hypothetical protein
VSKVIKGVKANRASKDTKASKDFRVYKVQLEHRVSKAFKAL